MKVSNGAGGGIFDLRFLSLQFSQQPKEHGELRLRAKGLGMRFLSMARLSDEIDHES
jgi:hypothetical protein